RLVVDHDMAPGRGSGGRATIIRCLVKPPQLPVMTLSLSTKMVRLAEDRAMFKIARFEKQFRQASVTQPTHPSHRRSRHLLFTSDQPASKACTVSKSQQS